MFLWVPKLGIAKRVSPKISKKKTHRLQVIKTTGSTEGPDLYGSIVITPTEAQLGTKKLVRIPWGLQKRLVRVTVPPGSREGVLLRLSGLGSQINGDRQGDLFLRVMIR